MSSEIYTGPLFLVGMPRSGTKLLRALLNGHPSIYISQVETHFIPYWHAHWASYGDLKALQDFKKFYENAIQMPYFTYLQEQQNIISCDNWYHHCERFDLQEIYEVLMKHDTGMPEDTSCIWGDKTPSYLVHMPLLKELFPSARFVHIVRDVRDYCLSSKRAWGKNMLRSAQSWADSISIAMQDGRQLGKDYLLIRYEDLIKAPETQLQIICCFLDIEYGSSMLTLTATPENLGDTKGMRSIVSENKDKYLRKMDQKIQKKIESVTANELRELGYPVTHSGPKERLSPFILRFYQVIDGLNLIKFEIGNRGFFEAIKFRWKLFTTSNYKVRPPS